MPAAPDKATATGPDVLRRPRDGTGFVIGEGLSGGLQRRKTAIEIGLEVVDILEADVTPRRRAAVTPSGRIERGRTVADRRVDEAALSLGVTGRR